MEGGRVGRGLLLTVLFYLSPSHTAPPRDPHGASTVASTTLARSPHAPSPLAQMQALGM